jgi:hypothetical protein
MRKIIYSLLFLFTFGSLNAQTLLGENFSYTAGDTLAKALSTNGWFSFSGGVTNAPLVNNFGLTFAGHAGSAIGNSVTLNTSGQDVYKGFTTAGVTSGSVYASALVRVDTTQATGDYPFALLPDNSTSLFSARAFFRRSSANHYRVSISKASTVPTVYSSDSFVYGTAYLLVLKYTFNTTSTTDDSVSIYYLSTLPLTEPVTTTFGPVGGTQTDVANIGRFALRQGTAANAPRLVVDAIRVATTWANSPLPVQITSFEATPNTSSNTLLWITASEINNRGFEIQRSEQGKSFENIAFINGAGNSNDVKQYSYNDTEIEPSKAYCYRLKQIDFDGTSEYSKTVCAASRKMQMTPINTQPNPFNQELTIQLNAESEGNALVELLDMVGKVVASKQLNVSADRHEVRFDTNHLNNGIYFVRVKQQNEISTRRVIKN